MMYQMPIGEYQHLKLTRAPTRTAAYIRLAASFNRVAKQPIPLSNGSVLPAGAPVVISTDRAFDLNVLHKQEQSDMWRFNTGNARDRFVTLSIDHLTIAYSLHSCPGRFLAADVLKICLSFLLLQYDFQHVPGTVIPKPIEVEHRKAPRPGIMIQLRRRQEEIDLSSPATREKPEVWRAFGQYLRHPNGRHIYMKRAGEGKSTICCPPVG